MFVKNSNQLLNFTLIFFLILTITYYFIRLYHGVDFTDEMQYLYQFKSIYLNNKLFVDDYFIQQFVYLYLIYPIKFIKSFYPTISYLLLMRVCSLLLLVVVSFIIIKKFKNIESLIILLVFFNYFDRLGITPNYNNFAYIFGFLISYKLIYSTELKLTSLSILLVFLLSIYPTIGFFFYLFILFNLRSVRSCFRLSAITLFFGFFFLVILSFFEILEFNKLYDAIIFSRNISNFIILSNNKHLILLSFYIVFFILIYLYKKNFFLIQNILLNNHKLNLLIYSLALLFIILVFFSKYYETFYVLTYLILLVLLINIKKGEIEKNKFNLFISTIFLIIIMAFTSGNGIYRTQTAPMFFMPFLIYELYLSIKSNENLRKLFIFFFIFFVTSLFYLQYTKVYRIEPLLNNNIKLGGINSDFGDINLSKTQSNIYYEIKNKLILQDHRSLTILGNHPWIYSIYGNKKIASAMIFNHEFTDEILSLFSKKNNLTNLIITNNFKSNSEFNYNLNLYVDSIKDLNCTLVYLDLKIVDTFNKNNKHQIINPINYCYKKL